MSSVHHPLLCRVVDSFLLRYMLEYAVFSCHFPASAQPQRYLASAVRCIVSTLVTSSGSTCTSTRRRVAIGCLVLSQMPKDLQITLVTPGWSKCRCFCGHRCSQRSGTEDKSEGYSLMGVRGSSRCHSRGQTKLIPKLRIPSRSYSI